MSHNKENLVPKPTPSPGPANPKKRCVPWGQLTIIKTINYRMGRSKNVYTDYKDQLTIGEDTNNLCFFVI